ncbi:hypothetical protein ACSHT2_16665 [Bradyrhizobium sp. PUT101]|uniref:hypothetical protein n=1 Tax=Bradyrhizobium sp. PUT101 TaxID=3447427 RepID=UPI003F845DA2
MGSRGLILISILLPMIGAAQAQDRQIDDRPIGFLTPSKNIACQFFSDNGQGVLRCDIMNMDARPRRPADCERGARSASYDAQLHIWESIMHRLLLTNGFRARAKWRAPE